jgi:hypothetical protein
MDLSDLEAEEVSRGLELTPEDLSLRVKNLGILLGRRRPRAAELLWIVINHPEVNLGGYAFMSREEEGPEAYDAIRRAWDHHLTRSPENSGFIELAAEFARHDDAPYAEALLAKGAALEPQEPR